MKLLEEFKEYNEAILKEFMMLYKDAEVKFDKRYHSEYKDRPEVKEAFCHGYAMGVMMEAGAL